MQKDIEQLDTVVQIVTPENIAFDYRLAGPFRRLPAYAIDLLIRFAVLFAVQLMLSFLNVFSGTSGLFNAIFLLAMFLLEWFYGGFFETFYNGQTPGKWVMGIRVLTQNGQPITGLQAVMRNVLRVVDSAPLLSLQMFAAGHFHARLAAHRRRFLGRAGSAGT